MLEKKDIDKFRVPPESKVRLKDFDPGWFKPADKNHLDKSQAKKKALDLLDKNLQQLFQAQEILYADNRFAVLLIFQAMDAAGKDSTIKHVMTGVNPQYCQAFSFKQPSAEEIDHNFLWRYTKSLPERGRIGIFNRSYYEDVLVVKVHPEILDGQNLPYRKYDKEFWKGRYEDINNLELHLHRSGIIVLKFFLHVSKDEQRKRFIKRLENGDKNWKFSLSDLKERGHWNEYMEAYEECLTATSTEWAPWYIIPADHKWVTRAVVSDIIVSGVQSLDLKYPELSEDQKKQLAEARNHLAGEREA